MDCVVWIFRIRFDQSTYNLRESEPAVPVPVPVDTCARPRTLPPSDYLNEKAPPLPVVVPQSPEIAEPRPVRLCTLLTALRVKSSPATHRLPATTLYIRSYPL